MVQNYKLLFENEAEYLFVFVVISCGFGFLFYICDRFAQK